MSKISVTTIAGLTSGGDANKVKIESGDQLGIGTTPTHPLTVNGQIKSIGSNGETLQLQTSNQFSGVSFVGSDGTRDAIIDYDHTGGFMTLKAHTSSHDIRFTTGGYTERFRITDNGVTFNGDSAATNALDDYEEGTWTPSLGGNTTYTNNRFGKYTKIGRFVHADWDLTVNALGTGSAGVLTGFPFPMGNYGGVLSGYCSYYTGLAVTVTYLSCYIISNTSNMYFTGHNVGAAANIGNALSVFQNSTRVLGSVAYYVAQ